MAATEMTMTTTEMTAVTIKDVNLPDATAEAAVAAEKTGTKEPDSKNRRPRISRHERKQMSKQRNKRKRIEEDGGGTKAAGRSDPAPTFSGDTVVPGKACAADDDGGAKAVQKKKKKKRKKKKRNTGIETGASADDPGAGGKDCGDITGGDDGGAGLVSPTSPPPPPSAPAPAPAPVSPDVGTTGWATTMAAAPGGIGSKRKRNKMRRNGGGAVDEKVAEKSTAAAPAAARTLGKWFPSAKMVKTSRAPDACSILLFYQYAVPTPWPDARVSELCDVLGALPTSSDDLATLGGRMRVAPEGVNCTVSGSASAVRSLAAALSLFDPVAFASTEFKYVDGLPADRAFKDLRVLPVKELVHYGLGEGDAPLGRGGTHVDPREFHGALAEEETVVVDVRNHYEAALGRFDGQRRSGAGKVADGPADAVGAEYIDPLMRKSTDFPSWLAKPETVERLRGKKVLMYCTGGVRCERASAHLAAKMGDEVRGIYQLKGGVEAYFREFPDGGHFRGK
eukprot:CAMPEP_0194291208 /NCGR_PEP_ID=MMETSP0169-20130528/42989_1 /TAXON_ID=218684 /ORGANISM="Corethron pennatum, Strain L29A3" /LENGTH=507 /DNA_ID=CAMNT_0039039023 /DNA_START=23 /DNA_END=1543 /DNA_ORIENTATION=-